MVSLDMSSIKIRIQEVSIAEVSNLINEYKKFLALKLKYQDVPIIPSYLVDQIWHQHILDTRAYTKDCIDIFGYYVHHDPHLYDNDLEGLGFAQRRTLDLYKLEYGYIDTSIWNYSSLYRS